MAGRSCSCPTSSAASPSTAAPPASTAASTPVATAWSLRELLIGLGPACAEASGLKWRTELKQPDDMGGSDGSTEELDSERVAGLQGLVPVAQDWSARRHHLHLVRMRRGVPKRRSM